MRVDPIVKWLSNVDFEEVHETHFSKRFGETGNWLIEDPGFECVAPLLV